MRIEAICPVVVWMLAICLVGCKDEVADRNAANIKLITAGMHWNEARHIMGDYQYCDTINGLKWLGEDGIAEYEYIYKAPSLYSGDFIIFVSVQDSLVTDIYRGN